MNEGIDVVVISENKHNSNTNGIIGVLCLRVIDDVINVAQNGRRGIDHDTTGRRR